MKKILENKKTLLENMKIYFPLAVFLFFVSFFFGTLFVKLYPYLAEEMFEELVDAFSPLFKLSPLQMGVFIFLNNTIKFFFFIFLGALFALPTLLFLVFNGWVLGYVVGLTYPEIGFFGTFQNLFYHGIFELTGIFIGAALGFWIGKTVIEEIKNRGERSLKEFIFQSQKIKNVLSVSFFVFLYLIVPLLLIAAIIETSLIFYR